jgi:uncharacterized damage-inducible protein DinB
MSTNKIESFINVWEYETQNTIKLLESLPAGQYDFRPDPAGRSLGELAWHLAEGDAYMTHGIDSGFGGSKPPGIERPRTIEALAPGFKRIHADAVARVKKLKPEDLEREVTFFDGSKMKVRDILWFALLHHSIHHRGQLALMVRLAGGKCPGLYGPNREETEAFRAKAQA